MASDGQWVWPVSEDRWVWPVSEDRWVWPVMVKATCTCRHVMLHVYMYDQLLKIHGCWWS